MSEASEKLKQQTEGGVPTADHLRRQQTKRQKLLVERRAQVEAAIRSYPLRSVAIAAGVGFLAAICCVTSELFDVAASARQTKTAPRWEAPQVRTKQPLRARCAAHRTTSAAR